jgi:hypothetical protein
MWQCKQRWTPQSLIENTTKARKHPTFLLEATMTIDSSATEDPIPDNIKPDIIRGVWYKDFATPTASQSDLKSWDAALKFYTAECKKAILYNRGEYTTIRTHRDVIAVTYRPTSPERPGLGSYNLERT